MLGAVDVADLQSTMPPLVDFIKSLSRAGATEADRLYGCPGWVAHGFVDNALHTGMLGEAQWSLCVTCGAWLASHLWEHLTYSYDDKYVREDILPVFRGIAQFFLKYMWKDSDGVMHTGPTTSPENSYPINNNVPFKVNNLVKDVNNLPIDTSKLNLNNNMMKIAFGKKIQQFQHLLNLSPRHKDDVDMQTLRLQNQNRLKLLELQQKGHIPPSIANGESFVPPPPADQVSHTSLTFSPAIDISVLREVYIYIYMMRCKFIYLECLFYLMSLIF